MKEAEGGGEEEAGDDESEHKQELKCCSSPANAHPSVRTHLDTKRFSNPACCTFTVMLSLRLLPLTVEGKQATRRPPPSPLSHTLLLHFPSTAVAVVMGMPLLLPPLVGAGVVAVEVVVVVVVVVPSGATLVFITEAVDVLALHLLVLLVGGGGRGRGVVVSARDTVLSVCSRQWKGKGRSLAPGGMSEREEEEKGEDGEEEGGEG